MESTHPLITNQQQQMKFMEGMMMPSKDMSAENDDPARARRQSVIPGRKEMEQLFLSAAVMAQARGIAVSIPGTGLSIVPTSTLDTEDEVSARQVQIDDGLLPVDLPQPVPAVPRANPDVILPGDFPPPPPAPPIVTECLTVIPTSGIPCDPGLAFNPTTGSCDWPDNLIDIGCIPEGSAVDAFGNFTQF